MIMVATSIPKDRLTITLCMFEVLASFVQGEIEIGISRLVIAFLFSPYEIPMIEAIVISFIELINDRLR